MKINNQIQITIFVGRHGFLNGRYSNTFKSGFNVMMCIMFLKTNLSHIAVQKIFQCKNLQLLQVQVLN